MSDNLITARYDSEGKQSFDPQQNSASAFAVTSVTVKSKVVLTQAEYDALAVKDPNTEYNIVSA